MSPAQFHDQRPDYLSPAPLKINKDSHFIRKSPNSSSSSSSSAASSIGVVGPPAKPQQHRQPVIIYTHSPKVIHTHPKDFMALVQKLTGLSRSECDQSSNTKSDSRNSSPADENKIDKITGSDDTHDHDNESSSAITDENSSFLSPILDPHPGPFLTNAPVFAPNSAHYINCSDPFFYMPPNMRTSISSSAAFDAINEFQDY
ncbi:hypothetical protein SLEP1_g33269 [Rubroshorea leprosula]|uniref:VQ domain-containing protein n=1 Tax=Rubroshorea leprosula TaxID=152421 RepID=A0AAV5KG50_9ROSI|nr:hypothetical protein SLEP1_g33269 [Rubroshorea leprosula]